MTSGKRVLLCAVGTVGILSAGCQTQYLKITPYTGVGEGAPYALRFTQYNTKIKWRVTSCGRRSPRPGEVLSAIPDKPFTVTAEVTSEATYPDDPERRWLIDLHSLDGWINTTDLSVTYEGGHFKAFNATVEDKTVETLTAVAETAVKVAALAAAVTFTGQPDACADLVEAADVATAAVEKRTKALQLARATLAVGQALPPSVIRQREGAVEQAAAALTADTEALAKALKAVTHDQEVRWPLSGSSSAPNELKLSPEAIKKWSLGSRWPEAGHVAVRLSLLVADAKGGYVAPRPGAETDLEDQVKTGRLPVRVARPGALVATLLTPQLGGDDKEEELKRVESVVIQSGDLIYVPVSYRWPRSNSNGFAIDDKGHLTSVTHKQSAAPATTLAKSAGAVADAISAVDQSPLEKLKAENDLLTAKKSNAELKVALGPKAPESPEALELKTIQAEATLKKAQLELALYTRWLAGLQAAP